MVPSATAGPVPILAGQCDGRFAPLRASTMRPLAPILVIVILTALLLPVRAGNHESADRKLVGRARWSGNSITIAISNSLQAPGPNFAAGSDVVGAFHRALSRWSSVANVTFVETRSTLQSISPSANGDGVSLITIADTQENNSLFNGAELTGRTRVFYDELKGSIVEADIVINPHPVSSEGLPLQLSTDGSPGTYDLESTLAHEVGHLLGLEHSPVIGSTMQPRQALNGVYKLPATTERTLSENDQAAVRSLYGPFDNLSAIEGRMVTSSPEGLSIPASGTLVWAENVISGRVVASSITSSSGTFRIEGIPPGDYRVLAEDVHLPISGFAEPSAGDAFTVSIRGSEVANRVRVRSGVNTSLNIVFVQGATSQGTLKPGWLGMNGDLSTTPVPLEAGQRFTIYVAGTGVDAVPGSGITVTSPFMTVDATSLKRQQPSFSSPVISFDVTVAPNAPAGEYTVRLELNSGEVAFLTGGITIDPGTELAVANADDDPGYFVAHHYRDFLGREPDPEGFGYWVGQLKQCGEEQECLRKRRLAVSAAFLGERESQDLGAFVYGLYRATLGRPPKLVEFIADREQLQASTVADSRKTLARVFVERTDLLEKFPTEMTAEQFVDRLLLTVNEGSGVNLQPERPALLALYDGTVAGRAAIIQRVIDNVAFKRAESTRAFVLLQYFGYLRRDPDPAGYEFWINTLKNRSLSDPGVRQSMACAFLTSAEYQLRFGNLVTHDKKECGR